MTVGDPGLGTQVGAAMANERAGQRVVILEREWPGARGPAIGDLHINCFRDFDISTS